MRRCGSMAPGPLLGLQSGIRRASTTPGSTQNIPQNRYETMVMALHLKTHSSAPCLHCCKKGAAMQPWLCQGSTGLPLDCHAARNVATQLQLHDVQL